MPTLLITTQVYPPEIAPGAVMARELAEGLVQRGWRVWVAAGLPHHPDGRVPNEYRRKWRIEDVKDGLTVIRQWHPTSPNRRPLVRAGVMAGQSLATVLAGLGRGRLDLVLSFAGPPLLGPSLSAILAMAYGARLVTVIHDLYPDVAIDTGRLTNPIAIGVARGLERIQYARSDRLVVLGPRTAQTLMRKGVAPERVHVVPVWLDPAEISPRARDNGWRQRHGIAVDKFVALYAGTVGIVSGARLLVDVARRLPDDAMLLIVGGGEEWDHLRAAAEQQGLTGKLKVLRFQEREHLPDVQATADISLVTLLPGRGKTSVPSKVQAYMAAGRPILASVDADSDTALLLQDTGAGWVVPPGNAGEILQALLNAKADPEGSRRKGTLARTAFEAKFGREQQVAAYDNLLRDCVVARTRSTRVERG